MKTYDIFKLSLSHVRKSKMRSRLTIVGIVIGVAAIVAIISIGEGMQASVQKSLGSLGGDLITVYVASTANLTDKDVNMIKQVPGILYVRVCKNQI
jgi:putative ABC transport system permease protein